MSETRDKRRRTDLDLFVLALIESGIATAYELQRTAHLSPGATIPALQRLLGSGFVRQSKPTARGRMDHKITAEGRKRLKAGWRDLIENGPSGDSDADLRVALLAWWVGGERRLAVDFLKESAKKRLRSLEGLEDGGDERSRPALADWYVRLRGEIGREILKAESAAALAIAEALPRGLAGKRGR